MKTMWQGLGYLLIFVIFIFANVSGKKNLNVGSRMKKLENYVRDEIYFLHQKLEDKEAEKATVLERINETLEYFETVRHEVKTVLDMYSSKGRSEAEIRNIEKTNSAIQQCLVHLDQIQKGFMSEKKVRIESAKTIFKRMKELEDNVQLINSNSTSAIEASLSGLKTNFQSLEKSNHLLTEKTGVLENETGRHKAELAAIQNFIQNNEKLHQVLEDMNATLHGKSIKQCAESTCKNGGVCISQDGFDTCYCPAGYAGLDCSKEEESPENIRLTILPEDRQIVRGSTHSEECKAELKHGRVIKTYKWTFNGQEVKPFDATVGFGAMPGGLLHINSFVDELVGNYSCLAVAKNGATAETSFVYDLIESCPAVIESGPKNVEKKTGDSVMLECYAPTAKNVIWTKDSHLIDFDHQPRFKLMINNYLLIEKLEKNDEGTYRCEASTQSKCYSYKEGRLSVNDLIPIKSYCGRTIYDEAVIARISTGDEARPRDYPWHAVFRATKNDGEITFAGGTLISQRWVLTSASIVTDFQSFFHQEFGRDSVKIYLGASDCLGESGIVRYPAKILVHENYGLLAAWDSDIALIELDIPVEYTSAMRPVCIESSRFNDIVFFRKDLRLIFGKVAGCGNDSRRRRTRNLMEVTLPFVNQNDCKEMYEEAVSKYSLPENVHVTDQMFCAGYAVRRKGDACSGDSGEAFLMYTDNRWVQTGIVSFGIECDRGYYGVYTNVGKFFDWIRNHTHFDQEVYGNII